MTPRATYRLQFNRDFTFADAAALASYLSELGVSHLYASPWLKACSGSSHGYDVVDYTAFNPELGGKAGFNHLSEALAKHGLGHILDFVPNHMGIAGNENAWWMDVLEWGPASPFADFFDIDWSPPDPRLRDKILLPFLGDSYGAELEAGKLVPRFDASRGAFSVEYYDHRFPLMHTSYAVLIRAAMNKDDSAAPALKPLAAAFERLQAHADSAAVRAKAEALKMQLADDASLHDALRRGAESLTGTPGEPQTFTPLHHLLERQHYRLACWRTAADEINYRRFFDINGLAGIRVEDRKVFERIHTLVARLLLEDKLDGLRIDHIDGLYDPARYCRRLRRLVRRRCYVVVEKILGVDEALRDWPVDGTTGYDFMNQVNALLIDARAEAPMTQAYRRFTGCEAGFDEVLHKAKLQVIEASFHGELCALAQHLHRIASQQARTRDYTLHALTRALAEVAAAFPIYRTYADAEGANGADRDAIARATAQARARWHGPDDGIFDFISTALVADKDFPLHKAVLRFAMQFQQFTSPVTAKGFEDTALYRYHRLIGLNDVGGDPNRFGMPVAAFHEANGERAAHWPHAMLTTATHDSKRGEDVRARLAVLSEMPWAWTRAVHRWARLNRPYKTIIEGAPVPDRNDEYLLYQTLIGAWPVELMGDAGNEHMAEAFRQRIQACMTKSLREAKQHSSWSDPDLRYEQAMSDFVARILDRQSGHLFLDAFLPLQRRVAELGVHKSLVQLALKLTCPGVPDIYQGGELWDLNLVDPDNRRAVDFDLRRRLLKDITAFDALPPEQQMATVERWRMRWHDGAIKMHVLHRLLRLRAEHPALFAKGDYQPIDIRGVDHDAAIAFERVARNERVVVAATLRAADSRTMARRLHIEFQQSPQTAWHDVLSCRTHAPAAHIGGQALFAQLPVAVLVERN